MAMHPQVASLLTLALLLATGDGILAVGTPSAIITRTCAAVGRPGEQLGYEYESCVGALSSDPAARRRGHQPHRGQRHVDAARRRGPRQEPRRLPPLLQGDEQDPGGRAG